MIIEPLRGIFIGQRILKLIFHLIETALFGIFFFYSQTCFCSFRLAVRAPFVAKISIHALIVWSL